MVASLTSVFKGSNSMSGLFHTGMGDFLSLVHNLSMQPINYVNSGLHLSRVGKLSAGYAGVKARMSPLPGSR